MGTIRNVETIKQLPSSAIIARFCWRLYSVNYKRKFSEELPEEQAGFQKGWGTADLFLCTSDHDRETEWDQRNCLHHFYWLQQGLWQCKSQPVVQYHDTDGLPANLVCFIQNLYVKQEARIWWIGTQNHSALGKVSGRGAYCPHISSVYIQMSWVLPLPHWEMACALGPW